MMPYPFAEGPTHRPRIGGSEGWCRESNVEGLGEQNFFGLGSNFLIMARQLLYFLCHIFIWYWTSLSGRFRMGLGWEYAFCCMISLAGNEISPTSIL